jgi:hypothetical protein
VGHRRQITTIDLIFGTYTVVIAALAGLAWLNGAGSPRSVVVFLAFLLANALISGDHCAGRVCDGRCAI